MSVRVFWEAIFPEPPSVSVIKVKLCITNAIYGSRGGSGLSRRLSQSSFHCPISSYEIASSRPLDTSQGLCSHLWTKPLQRWASGLRIRSRGTKPSLLHSSLTPSLAIEEIGRPKRHVSLYLIPFDDLLMHDDGQKAICCFLVRLATTFLRCSP